MIEDLVRHITGAGGRPADAGLVVAPVGRELRAAARTALIEAIDQRGATIGVATGTAEHLCVVSSVEADLLVAGNAARGSEALRTAHDALDEVVRAIVAWFDDPGSGSDLIQLEGRREALERRVAELERTSLWGGTLDLRAVARWVSARVAAVRACGANGEPLPLLVDDPFRPVRGDDKRALLDMLARMSTHCPIVYLTVDPDVALWARRREAADPVTTAARQSSRRNPVR